MLLIQRGKEERLISQLITLLALPRHKHSRWDSIKSPSLVHWLSSAARSIALSASGSPVFSVVGSWCLIALTAPGFSLVLFFFPSAYYRSVAFFNPLLDWFFSLPTLYSNISENQFISFFAPSISLSTHCPFSPPLDCDNSGYKRKSTSSYH